MPSTTALAVGETVQVDIRIEGLGDGAAPSVGAFDLDLAFDPAILSVSAVSFGDPLLGDQLDLEGFGSLGIATEGAGEVNLFQLSFDSIAALDTLQAPAFTLARAELLALRAGSTQISPEVRALSDSRGLPLELTTRSVSVSVPIPEPSSWLCFGAGLLAAHGAVRRAPRRRAPG